MTYSSEYYQQGNYKNYLERSEKYRHLSDDIRAALPQAHKILDFGCGVGFLAKALGEDCTGYDISNWAVAYGRYQLQLGNITTSYEVVHQKYDLTLFLDVLEHIEIPEIHKILEDINTKYIIVRIPVPEVDGGQFVLEVSENDPTHITRLNKQSWIDLLSTHQYLHEEYLHSDYIWDSPGVLCAIFRSTTH